MLLYQKLRQKIQGTEIKFLNSNSLTMKIVGLKNPFASQFSR